MTWDSCYVKSPVNNTLSTAFQSRTKYLKSINNFHENVKSWRTEVSKKKNHGQDIITVFESLNRRRAQLGETKEQVSYRRYSVTRAFHHATMSLRRICTRVPMLASERSLPPDTKSNGCLPAVLPKRGFKVAPAAKVNLAAFKSGTNSDRMFSNE